MSTDLSLTQAKASGPARPGPTVDQVNYLNISLMALSAVLALAHPVAVFLFSYAVLGPLHYLTEISWLHDRRYFTKGRNDYLIFAAICLVFTLQAMGVIAPSVHVMVSLLFLSVVAAGVFAFTPSTRLRVTILCAAALFLPIVSGSNVMLVILGFLLPTMIHVFVFTGMFILAGTLKQRSVSGMLSLIVFIALSAGLLLWHPDWPGHTSGGDYFRRSYGDAMPDGKGASGFLGVNYLLLKLLTPNAFPTAGTAVTGITDFLYEHPIARSVMAFIAFSYTYHYLNWFSKTSVIRWHKVPKKRLSAILAIWLSSLAVYATDYSLGARWLFFLSFLHVLLELPLNHVTFRNILNMLNSPKRVVS